MDGIRIQLGANPARPIPGAGDPSPPQGFLGLDENGLEFSHFVRAGCFSLFSEAVHLFRRRRGASTASPGEGRKLLFLQRWESHGEGCWSGLMLSPKPLLWAWCLFPALCCTWHPPKSLAGASREQRFAPAIGDGSPQGPGQESAWI